VEGQKGEMKKRKSEKNRTCERRFMISIDVVRIRKVKKESNLKRERKTVEGKEAKRNIKV